MRIGIMQPYFLPYIGYFQLIHAVDKFIIYDNIQFTKKGWINRNRILQEGNDEYITLPLKKDSDYLNIDDRWLANSYEADINKLLRKIGNAYKQAPYYNEVFPILRLILTYKDHNLFKFVLNSILTICEYLDINNEIIISSTLPINHQLKAQDKVIAICNALNASHYINLSGGMELYSKKVFKQQHLDLNFIKMGSVTYPQFKKKFVPNLSIIDAMMFSSKLEIKNYVQSHFSIS